jgi:hypothetical protein
MPVMRAGYRGDYMQVGPDSLFTLERPPGS